VTAASVIEKEAVMVNLEWQGSNCLLFVTWHLCTVLLYPVQLVSCGQVVTTCTCFLNGELWQRYCVCNTIQYYVSAYKNRICLLIRAGHNYSDDKKD